jgi:hypothetical protein
MSATLIMFWLLRPDILGPDSFSEGGEMSPKYSKAETSLFSSEDLRAGEVSVFCVAGGIDRLLFERVIGRVEDGGPSESGARVFRRPSASGVSPVPATGAMVAVGSPGAVVVSGSPGAELLAGVGIEPAMN